MIVEKEIYNSKKRRESMYKFIQLFVYILSVVMSMFALSCFKYEDYIKRSKIREFYLFYIMASIALGYLFGSFILSFVSASYYSLF